MEIRALNERDDRSSFQSGDHDLDRFFHLFAGQNQFKHHLGVSYVAVDRRRLLGFATVAPGNIDDAGLPVTFRGKLPRYPLPVLRLARLAVDRSAQGGGVGAALLRYVLRLAERMASEFGCVGVVVDAKPAGVSLYLKYGFAQIDAVEGGSDSRPRSTPMFLAVSEIRDGLGLHADAPS